MSKSTRNCPFLGSHRSWVFETFIGIFFIVHITRVVVAVVVVVISFRSYMSILGALLVEPLTIKKIPRVFIRMVKAFLRHNTESSERKGLGGFLEGFLPMVLLMVQKSCTGSNPIFLRW